MKKDQKAKPGNDNADNFFSKDNEIIGIIDGDRVLIQGTISEKGATIKFKKKSGRKKTGRVRNELFPGRFSPEENEEIREKAKEIGKTQSDTVLTGIRKLKKGK